MFITFNEFLLENEEILPDVLIRLKEKSKKFKDPIFYLKANDGGIYFKTTWYQIVQNYHDLEKYIKMGRGMTEEKMLIKLAQYDVYGTKKPQSINVLLNKEYDHPAKIPIEVYEYIQKNGNLITNDASDAVRWCRILNTEDDERYEEDEITIYRAVDNRNYDEIRPGDWVTLEEQYAINHNEKYFNGRGKVISENVNGKDVLVSPTGDPEEAIYAPLKYSKPYEYYIKK
jgi:hypothetical protein